MENLRYEAPGSLEDASGLIRAEAGDVRLLAGGTDIMVQMHADMIEPDLIVDLKGIPELRAVSKEPDGWRIGAAVTGLELMDNADFCADWPGVMDGVRLIGSVQIRGRASLGGNLCNASPAADSVPPLIAADAIATVFGPDGSREVPVGDIAIGPGKTSLSKGEIVVSFTLPPRPPRSGDAYLRFTPRTEMDIAVVGVGVNLTLDEAGVCQSARVAVGAVAERALLVTGAADALVGTSVDEAALEAHRRRRAGRLPAYRRQARHQGVPDQGCGRARPSGSRGSRYERAQNGRGRKLMQKYHVTATINGDDVDFLCEASTEPARRAARRAAHDGHQGGLRHRRLRRLQRDPRRHARLLLPGARRRGGRQVDRDHRGHGRRAMTLHPLQRKFIDHVALQCGICTPGLLVASKKLLERNAGAERGGDPLLARRQSLPLHGISESRRSGGWTPPRN